MPLSLQATASPSMQERRLRGSESIIDPELADGDSLPDVHPRDLDGSTSKRSSQSYRARTKVVVIVFSLSRPIAPERPLDAATNGPARSGLARFQLLVEYRNECGILVACPRRSALGI